MRSYKGNVLSISYVQRILKNPFYYGVFVFNGEIYQGSHQPIITKKLFDKCQEVMKERGRKRQRKVLHLFPFRGFLNCGECGCAITAEVQKGHIYYRCTKTRGSCSQRYIREEELTKQIIFYLQKVSLSSQDTWKVLRELEKHEQKAREESKVYVQGLKEQLKDIETKLDKLLSAYLDEIISAEEYTARKQKMLTRKIELKEEIREIDDKGVSWLEPARAFVLSLNQAEKLIKEKNKQEMTTFLKNIGSNHILIDKTFQFLPKNEYKLVAERRAAARREASKTFTNPIWRRGWDSNPRALYRARLSKPLE